MRSFCPTLKYPTRIIKEIVLYNAASVIKSKCPDLLRNVGTHLSMKSYNLLWCDYRYDYI